MRKQVLLLLVIGIVLFGVSLLNFLSYIGGKSHFSIVDGLLIPLVGFILSLSMLRKTLWLLAIVLLETWLLRDYGQRIRRYPQNADACVAVIRILMRLVCHDCERMKYFLAWDATGAPTRNIGTRIKRNLERIDTMLQTLDTTFRLNPLGFLMASARSTTPLEHKLARNKLESFKSLFPLEVEKTPFDEPGYLFVDVLQRLCATIAMNPMYADAFASGAGLMEYLHREESARNFQHIAAWFEQAPVMEM